MPCGFITVFVRLRIQRPFNVTLGLSTLNLHPVLKHNLVVLCEEVSTLLNILYYRLESQLHRVDVSPISNYCLEINQCNFVQIPV